jgi:hypothetical protein
VIGQHQAAILTQLASAEAHAQEHPTLEELVEVTAAAAERSPSATRESVQALIDGGSVERVPEDSRKDWDVARLRMTDDGRADLAAFRAKHPVERPVTAPPDDE